MAHTSADEQNLVTRSGPNAVAGSRRRINPQLLRDAVPLAEGLLIVAAGWLSFVVQPALHVESWRASSAFVGALILLSFVSLTRLSLAGVDAFISQSTPRRVLSAFYVAPAPFCLTLTLTFACLSPGIGAGRAGFIRWQWIWAAAALSAAVGTRLLFSWLILRWRAQGVLTRRIAIVGHGELGHQFYQWLCRAYPETIDLVGVFDDRALHRSPFPELRALVRGNIEDLIELSKELDLDQVVVALPHSAAQRLVEILAKLRCIPVDIGLAPDRVGFALPTRRPGEFGGPPLVQVYGRPLEYWEGLIKAGIDRALALSGLALLGPLLLLVGIAVRLTSPGPVLFVQDRYGLGNRVIKIYKFRTMYAELGDEAGARQTQRNDHRATPVGRFLRRTSLDELPQLLNVLRGEMSLVGPRALPVHMRVQDKLNYEIVADYALRHRVKPGMTGWAQVNGYRGAVDSAEALRIRVSHDLSYIDNWSLWLDIWILLMTPKVALGHKNAF
jgi:Undecaprenyl-phosphate glucose phosphotransferase